MDEGSAGRNAATYTQIRTNTEQTHTYIHASSGIGTHDPSVRVGENGSYLRPGGHCDRPFELALKKGNCCNYRN
jgi:hypothetical protein